MTSSWMEEWTTRWEILKPSSKHLHLLSLKHRRSECPAASEIPGETWLLAANFRWAASMSGGERWILLFPERTPPCGRGFNKREQTQATPASVRMVRLSCRVIHRMWTMCTFNESQKAGVAFV